MQLSSCLITEVQGVALQKEAAKVFWNSTISAGGRMQTDKAELYSITNLVDYAGQHTVRTRIRMASEQDEEEEQV